MEAFNVTRSGRAANPDRGLDLRNASPILAYQSKTARGLVTVIGMGSEPLSVEQPMVQQALFNQRARDFLAIVEDARNNLSPFEGSVVINDASNRLGVSILKK